MTLREREDEVRECLTVSDRVREWLQYVGDRVSSSASRGDRIKLIPNPSGKSLLPDPPADHSADLHPHTHIISEGDTRKTSRTLNYHACPDRPASGLRGERLTALELSQSSVNRYEQTG